MMKRALISSTMTILLISVLTGCAGNSKSEEESDIMVSQSEIVEETEKETVQEEVNEETVTPECEHRWKEATYSNPKICEICGISEGEPRNNYFKENNISIFEKPTELTTKICYWNKNNESDMDLVDGKLTVQEYKNEDSDEEGYNTVVLSVMLEFQIPYKWDGWHVNWNNQIYDLYSGRSLPSKDLPSGDEGYNYMTEVEVDGKIYTVEYTKENEWNDIEWYFDEAGNEVCDKKCTQKYVYKIPKEYDGLVYALIPSTEVPEYSDEIDETIEYALEDYEKGTQFFRITNNQ